MVKKSEDKDEAVKQEEVSKAVGIVKEDEEEVVEEIEEIKPIKRNLEERYFVDFYFLNFREGPQTNQKLLNELGRNTQLTILKHIDEKWARAQLDSGETGYVAKKYLTPVTPQWIAERQVSLLPILMYHYVGVIPEDADEMRKNLTTSKANLFAHLKYLKKNNIKTLTFRDLKDFKEGEREYNGSGAILTFDDGYKDSYTIVYSLLKQFGAKGVFFVVTDLIGTEGYMSWENLSEMSKNGMEIACHSRTHSDLRGLSGTALDNEVSLPKEIIEDNIGKEVITFAYPSGGMNTRVQKAVENAGYAFARTINPGKYISFKNSFALPALRIYPETADKQLKIWFE